MKAVKFDAWLNPWRFYSRHWSVLVKIASVITFPSIVLSAVGDVSSGIVGAYMYLAALFLNVAIIWTVAELDKGEFVTLPRAYYRGTSGVLVFLLTSLVITLQAIPLAFGLWVLTSVALASATLAEQILLGVVGVAVLVPTIYWLPRYCLAVFPAVLDQTTPITALRSSRQIVAGRWPQALARLGVIFVTALLIVVAPAALMALAANQTQGEIWLAMMPMVVQVIVNLVALPFAVISLYQLYRELK